MKKNLIILVFSLVFFSFNIVNAEELKKLKEYLNTLQIIFEINGGTLDVVIDKHDIDTDLAMVCKFKSAKLLENGNFKILELSEDYLKLKEKRDSETITEGEFWGLLNEGLEYSYPVVYAEGLVKLKEQSLSLRTLFENNTFTADQYDSALNKILEKSQDFKKMMELGLDDKIIYQSQNLTLILVKPQKDLDKLQELLVKDLNKLQELKEKGTLTEKDYDNAVIKVEENYDSAVIKVKENFKETNCGN